MSKKIFLRGFTLIELLVVIAIIGILATVVLASLNSARSKGADAAIMSSINNARAQAEIYYDDNGNSYDGVCTGTGGVSEALTAANDANGSGAALCVDSSASGISSGWAMEAQLVASTTAYYCVDSSGAAGEHVGSTITTSDASCG